MEPVTLEHFALEILYGVKRIEIPPRRSPFPASPQFTCGVQLRWRGENCGSEYRFWLADIFNNKMFRESFVENMASDRSLAHRAFVLYSVGSLG